MMGVPNLCFAPIRAECQHERDMAWTATTVVH